MNFEITEPTSIKFDTLIRDMKPGQFGVDIKGNVFLRSPESATCVNNLEETYGGNARSVTGHYVRILPTGTVITITV